MAVSWIWNIAFLAIIVLTSCCILHHKLVTSKKKNRLPPGPKGFPVIGHLHLIGKNPHQDFFSLAKQHGPIMYMRFGLVPHIIVSSPKAAELFLKTHDLVFAGRPPSQAAKYLSWDQKNLSFASYGPYWRYMRKICNSEMLSSHRINSFEPMRSEELSLFIESIKTDARVRGAVDLSAKASSLAVDMSCRMIFGKKYEENDMNDARGFKCLIHEGMRIAAVPNLGDFFPFLGILDLQGLTRKMKEVNKLFDGFFDMIIDDHVRKSCDSQEDIVDTLLSIMQSGVSEFQFDRGHVKSIMMDMLAGSMDSLASSIDWVMAELLKNPKVMKKVQNELEQVVGLNRMVEENDLEKLEYLYMVLKETFRLHPVGPLLIPHYSMEDCTVEGYDIPKGSRLFVNVYAIGRDPETWSDPEKFFPERFIGSDVDLRGKHFELLPFGSGRRGCPGMQLGLTQVRLVVAQLVHCFDWQLPNNLKPEKLDMTEEFGLVLARANHLMAIPTYRLSN